MPHDDPADRCLVRALSIRQPFAELILQGRKTIEYRSRPTHIIGERFYLYASQTWAAGGVGAKAWSTDLSMPGDGALPWLAELAEGARLFREGTLPTGVIVGSALIDRVTPGDDGLFRWHLAGVERLASPRKPTRHPQPAWFRPFN